MGKESVGDGEEFQLVEFKVEGDVHVDCKVDEIREVVGSLGMSTAPREGTINIFVPPARKDEAYLIADQVLKEVEGLSLIGVTSRKAQVAAPSFSDRARKFFEKYLGWGDAN